MSSPIRAVVSWSGGKDCCLALARAREMGIEVFALLAMFDKDGQRSRSHAVTPDVMAAQARALGLPLVTPAASWQGYEAAFVAALAAQRAQGVTHAIFGDIDLQDHREWEERACVAAGLTAVLPLWQEARGAVVTEILRRGIRPFVVCTDDRHLPASFCGRIYDERFVADLPAGVDACGEGGEFHTFVTDGPGFSTPLDVTVDRIEPHGITFAGRPYGYHYARLSLRDESTEERAALSAIRAGAAAPRR